MHAFQNDGERLMTHTPARAEQRQTAKKEGRHLLPYRYW